MKRSLRALLKFSVMLLLSASCPLFGGKSPEQTTRQPKTKVVIRAEKRKQEFVTLVHDEFLQRIEALAQTGQDISYVPANVRAALPLLDDILPQEDKVGALQNLKLASENLISYKTAQNAIRRINAVLPSCKAQLSEDAYKATATAFEEYRESLSNQQARVKVLTRVSGDTPTLCCDLLLNDYVKESSDVKLVSIDVQPADTIKLRAVVENKSVSSASVSGDARTSGSDKRSASVSGSSDESTSRDASVSKDRSVSADAQL